MKLEVNVKSFFCSLRDASWTNLPLSPRSKNGSCFSEADIRNLRNSIPVFPSNAVSTETCRERGDGHFRAVNPASINDAETLCSPAGRFVHPAFPLNWKFRMPNCSKLRNGTASRIRCVTFTSETDALDSSPLFPEIRARYPKDSAFCPRTVPVSVPAASTCDSRLSETENAVFRFAGAAVLSPSVVSSLFSETEPSTA